MDIETYSEDRVLTIRLNRPEKKNALNAAMYSAIVSTLEKAQQDPAVHVVVITGSDQCFTAGNDIQNFLETQPGDQELPAMKFLRLLPTLQKPLVAAVEGVAIGIGTTLLMHCDLVVAGESARLRMPFVDLGVVPEAGSSLLLPLTVGPQRAAKMLLLTETVDARTALELGLVGTVVTAGQAYSTAMEQARQLAAKPIGAVIATRRLLRMSTRTELLERIEVEMDEFMSRLQSAEAKAVFKAFLGKGG
jgi:enoyl-CoA hydratase/carnithine racemase